MNTNASLVDSTLAGARFPSATVDFQMAAREIRAKFTGPFEQLPGSLFTERKELADTTLNGSAEMAVALTVPKAGPTELLNASGTATLEKSTIAGMAIDSGQVTGSFANQIGQTSRSSSLTGPDMKASAAGTLALGDTGESKLAYDVAVTNLEPLAKRFNRPLAGSAHVVGEASGPAANLTLAGKLGANRLRYSTNVDALTANSTYTVQLPNFDIEQARIQADTAATFVTVAGRNLPRVTAKTVYEKNELQFDAMVEEERRSLGLGGNVVFHPDHDELHLRALNLTVGKTQWALPAGAGSRPRRYSQRFGDAREFRAAARHAALTAAGTVAIGAASANLANDLNVRLDNVEVQDINELLLGNRSLAGVLNASAEIRGTRNDPVVAVGFRGDGRHGRGVKFNALTGKANYAGRAVDLDARLEQTPAAVLTAVGTIPVPNGPGTTARTEEFDLAVKSTPIDIALFQPATTQLTKLTGQFRPMCMSGNPRGAPIERAGRNDQRRLQRGRHRGDLHQRDRAPDVRGRSIAGGSLRAERRRSRSARGHRRARHRAPQRRGDEPAGIDLPVQGARQPVRRHADRQRPARDRRCGEADRHRRNRHASPAASKWIRFSSSCRGARIAPKPRWRRHRSRTAADGASASAPWR